MAELRDKTIGIAGLFDDPGAIRAAAKLIRDARFEDWDCHTPYPVHGLEQAMGLRSSPVPYVTLTAGFLGVGAALLLTWSLNAIHYPIRIGGKALFSWQAYVPIFFEMFVLFAALATMASVILFCKLGRWHSPLHDSDLMREVTGTRFAVVIRTEDEGAMEKARTLLNAAGCDDVRPLFERFESESEELI
jgi:hypothetical protein